MGLGSAMNTALTGLSAAETQLDVSGNNLANSQTVGFKASDAIFATQFNRTLSLGSGPSTSNGGTNPRQIGLGVQVAEIKPDFDQGTIEISSSPSDMAIQGDGFFIVQGSAGEQLYTRNGIFKPNSANEMVTVTGERVLGFGVDDSYNIQNSQLVPLTIPLGSAAVTQATENVFVEGNLRPDGDIADTAEVIDSPVLGDGSIDQPDIASAGSQASQAAQPDSSGTATASVPGGSFTAGDQYEYSYTFVDGNGRETMASVVPNGVTIANPNDQVTLSNLPASPLDGGGSPIYNQLNVYRRKLNVPPSDNEFDFKLVGNAAQGAASFTDNVVTPGALQDNTGLTGSLSYMVTYSGPGVPESRPSDVLGPVNITNGRIFLDSLPTPPAGPGLPNYTTVNLYRNLTTDSSEFYLVDSIGPGATYTDGRSDSEISDLSNPANRTLDVNGPPITNGTLLTNVIQRNGNAYEPLFMEGILDFTGTKGDVELSSKSIEITATSTVGDLLQFFTSAMGIQSSNPSDPNPIPGSVDNISGSGGILNPGSTLTGDGRIRVIGNNGVANAVGIGTDAFRMVDTGGNVTNPVLDFQSMQSAVGESISTDFPAYDSLGISSGVRLTAALETRDGDTATYRWFADSGENDEPGNDVNISVGTGLITFDNEGNLINTNGSQVSILRSDIPSISPLSFDLDFSQVSGVASPTGLNASRQDGAPPGTLTSYTVQEDGIIKGIFSNGVFRDLGQVRLARFSNPTGLEQKGRNMYSQGVNSGLPVQGNPGDQGLGRTVSGALELSNTDVGENLIDLILATTMYRSNSRVISTAQTMLDELLNLRR